jgi:hypothetical protein
LRKTTKDDTAVRQMSELGRFQAFILEWCKFGSHIALQVRPTRGEPEMRSAMSRLRPAGNATIQRASDITRRVLLLDAAVGSAAWQPVLEVPPRQLAGLGALGIWNFRSVISAA